ncbi:MAG: GNAT family N-acetyltransferase [Geodermatophilaceae bacterium]|nr:GNAT family N-acetyltransferase [Geodermatophilaceae bacterium]
MDVLARLERYYDAIPRSDATVEVHGPLTLYVGAGAWSYYARPTLVAQQVDAQDVRRMCGRMAELRVPQAFEWVAESTPSMATAVRQVGLAVADGPLLVAADPLAVVFPSGVRVLVVGAEDDRLAEYLALARVSFGDDVALSTGDDVAHMRERIADGRTVLMVAVDDRGPMAVGSHQPVQVAGEWITELVGLGTLAQYRGRGLAAAIASALAEHASAFCDLVFLSAGDGDVARVYERAGFIRVGTACVGG